MTIGAQSKSKMCL